MSKVKKCTCISKFQDEIYGKNNRLCTKQSKNETCKCTVCGIIHKDK